MWIILFVYKTTCTFSYNLYGLCILPQYSSAERLKPGQKAVEWGGKLFISGSLFHKLNLVDLLNVVILCSVITTKVNISTKTATRFDICLVPRIKRQMCVYMFVLNILNRHILNMCGPLLPQNTKHFCDPDVLIYE